MTDYDAFLLARSTLRLQEATATADRIVDQADRMTRDLTRLSFQLATTAGRLARR